ncbi:MAG: septum formation protein Maf [Bdellovibrionales bacterium]|nr:septum formation protein Maf [Bdellovibrionales bacterium]
MKYPYPLILASTSKYRGALLAQLGWSFEAIAPGVDEDQLKTKNLSPTQLAMELARLKAQAVFAQRPDACVIGSDQVCMLNGELLGKPGTKEKAIQQLQKMQGIHHELITAVTILSPHGEVNFHNRTLLFMRPLNLEQIAKYVEEDRPLDCAGSYKLETRGIKLFEKIEMDDHTSIIGLPLIQLNNHLLQIGYPL